jgi:hypothetical protein
MAKYLLIHSGHDTFGYGELAQISHLTPTYAAIQRAPRLFSHLMGVTK